MKKTIKLQSEYLLIRFAPFLTALLLATITESSRAQTKQKYRSTKETNPVDMGVVRFASHPVTANAANDPILLPSYKAVADYLMIENNYCSIMETSNQFDLKDKTAIVNGGVSGIGKTSRNALFMSKKSLMMLVKTGVIIAKAKNHLL